MTETEERLPEITSLKTAYKFSILTACMSVTERHSDSMQHKSEWTQTAIDTLRG